MGYTFSSERTSTVIDTATITTTIPVTYVITSTAQPVIVPCSDAYPNGTAPPDAPSVYVRQGATAFLCVQYYYYNYSSTMSVNTSSIVSLQGYRSVNNSQLLGFDPSPNFTISARPEEITLGGANNLNEGALVLYAIHAKSNSSGTYTFSLLAALYPSMEDCAGFSKIIVGSGSPDYHRFGSCTAPLSGSYPLNSEGFIDGFLFAKVVGITNSSS